jgi:uncharacterized protein with NRDE domain
MCTVVFIPNNDKIIFASLRDESPLRKTAITPEHYKTKDILVLAPKDALAGGTWLGINNHQNVIILLNGGFVKHSRKESYRMSRGLIVNELLQSEMPVVDWELLNLDEIEPFSLLVWSEEMLFHLVWDGETKFRTKLDTTIPHILSSSTLYDFEAKEKRSLIFNSWLKTEPQVNKQSLISFFKSVIDSENGFIMNRNEKVKTLSYSYIELFQNDTATLDYYDLQNFSHSMKSLKMQNSSSDCAIYTA